MNCIFNWCEFYNVVLGGILVGVIASAVFTLMTRIIAIRKFKKQYNYLQSSSENIFDWMAYSMKPENGRVRDKKPNGSVLKIRLNKDRIYLTLKQVDGRIWEGEFKVESFDYGIVTYKYQDEHEYGTRQCFIGHYVEDNKTYDYLFLIPMNNRIYYIKKNSDDKLQVVYNYGDEIFIRARN